jgi:hypothetical protein
LSEESQAALRATLIADLRTGGWNRKWTQMKKMAQMSRNNINGNPLCHLCGKKDSYQWKIQQK